MATHCWIPGAYLKTRMKFSEAGPGLYMGSPRNKDELELAMEELQAAGLILICPEHEDCAVLAQTVERRGVAATREIRGVWRIEYRPYRREQAWVWHDDGEETESWRLVQFCPTLSAAQEWVASNA